MKITLDGVSARTAPYDLTNWRKPPEDKTIQREIPIVPREDADLNMWIRYVYMTYQICGGQRKITPMLRDTLDDMRSCGYSIDESVLSSMTSGMKYKWEYNPCNYNSVIFLVGKYIEAYGSQIFEEAFISRARGTCLGGVVDVEALQDYFHKVKGNRSCLQGIHDYLAETPEQIVISICSEIMTPKDWGCALANYDVWMHELNSGYCSKLPDSYLDIVKAHSGLTKRFNEILHTRLNAVSKPIAMNIVDEKIREYFPKTLVEVK